MQTIKRQELVDALEAVQPGLVRKESGDLLQAFIFRKDGWVFTYNDEVSVRHPCPCKVEGAVKAAELHRLLSRMSAGEIDVSAEGNEFRVGTNRVRAGIAMDAEADIPIDKVDVPGVDDPRWKELPKNFLQALDFCMVSVGTDMTRPLMTCIWFEGETASSTDAIRITQYRLAAPIEEPFLLPHTVYKDIKRYTYSHYHYEAGWVHFKTATNCIFSCRTYGEEYMDLTPHLKIEGGQEFTLPDTLDESVGRMMAVLEGAEGTDCSVTFAAQNKHFYLNAKTENGYVKEKIPTTFEGEFRALVNPRFLTDAFQLIRKVTLTTNRMKFTGENFVHLICLMQKQTPAGA